MLNKAAEAIFNGDDAKLPPGIFNTYNDNLHKAVSGVDAESAKLLKNNLTRMAAAKANYTVELLKKARIEANGSKEAYTKKAKRIISRANTTQAAEYNAAVHRTRVFKQYKRFEENKRLFPNIEWLRTRSASPREAHLAYVGRVWPIGDPFLLQNQPGCVWGCKCDWKNTSKPVTENSDVKIVAPSPGLEGNPAFTNELVTDKHPYFKRVEKHIPELGVLNNPDELVYLKKTDANGKAFLMHYNNRNEQELANNVKAISVLNEIGFGKEIKLLPRIYKKHEVLRQRYYGKAFQELHKFDCPDAMIDGRLVEFKSSNRRNASKRILQASKKADIVYLEMNADVSDDFITKFVEEQWESSDRLNLHTIIIRYNGKAKVHKRP